MAADSSILAGEIPWTEEPRGYSSRCCKESDTTEQLSKQHTNLTTNSLLLTRSLTTTYIVD